MANLTNSLCRLCAVTVWRLCCYRLKLCNGIPQGRLLSHANISFFSVFAVLSKLLQTQMGNLSWPCFGQNSSLVHRICLLIYLVPFSFISFKQSSAYIYIYTAWNIYINTSKLLVTEVDT